MSIWGFLGSNTQKQSLWNIAPKISVSYFQGRMTRCPKMSSPDVKFWESYLKESVFWKSWNYILGKSKETLTYMFAHNDVWLLIKYLSVEEHKDIWRTNINFLIP